MKRSLRLGYWLGGLWLVSTGRVYFFSSGLAQQRAAALSPFSDVRPTSGVTFRQHNGAIGGKELIETFTSGCGVLDYNNDGLLDIYLVNGAAIPSLRKEGLEYSNRLYRNLGNFKFADVTQAAHAEGKGYGMGVAVGDYDNDGFPDLYITNFGQNQLLRNRGDGTFEDVTEKAGVGGGGWSTSAAFLDYDRDGYLDLYAGGYVEFGPSSKQTCKIGPVMASCPPGKSIMRRLR